MQKYFVPYEQALELKELEFDEPCLASWNFYTREFNYNGQPSTFSSEDVIQLPTFSQAFRWFGEKLHNTFPSIIQTRSWATLYKILEWNPSNDSTSIIESGYYDTYEEAELACLKKLIEIIKTK